VLKILLKNIISGPIWKNVLNLIYQMSEEGKTEILWQEWEDFNCHFASLRTSLMIEYLKMTKGIEYPFVQCLIYFFKR
jgi:hypothetical protein